MNELGPRKPILEPEDCAHLQTHANAGQVDTTALQVELGVSSHVGLRRLINEDCFHADVEQGLYLVADGMGGHAQGDVASALARETVAAAVANGASLCQAILLANTAVYRRGIAPGLLRQMGTTIAALRIQGRDFEAAWVGDSRIYLWRDQLIQLSHDHSLVQDLIDAGQITRVDARKISFRNILTQALGSLEPVRVGTVRGAVTDDMVFLLCSDGLTDGVTDAAIDDVLRRECAAQTQVDQLILAALERGGADNVTALVVKCSLRE